MHATLDDLAQETVILPKAPPAPVIPPAPDAPEHVRARYWREHIARMSRAEVADATGVSVSRIIDIEAGENRTTHTPIDADTMRRYRMACAAVSLGVNFDWITMSLIPDVPVEIRMFRLKAPEE